MANSKKPPFIDLSDHLQGFLADSINSGQTLLLGLSGGLDSCVLLHLLVGLRDRFAYTLRALHVNHGISPNASDWEDFCAELCASYAVVFEAVRVYVSHTSGLGLEAAARKARYDVLLAQPVDAVVLAHHQDDQAETLLLQLVRGAGVQGLAAMPARRERHAGQPLLLRPLLNVPRAQLKRYAHAYRLRWIEDESNLDLAYDRNFLRHRVLPLLAERFPACRATLARSAAHLAEAACLLKEVAAADAIHCVRDGGLLIPELFMLDEARAANLLRYWLRGLSGDISSRRLKEVMRQLHQARQDARLRVAVTGGSLQRYRNCLYFVPAVAEAGMAERVWQGETVLDLAGGQLHFLRAPGEGLALSKVEAGRLVIRRRIGGERFRPHCQRPTRSLKHLMQEAGIPPWRRDTLPLLYLNEQLALVPGIGVACELQATPGEAGLKVNWSS